MRFEEVTCLRALFSFRVANCDKDDKCQNITRKQLLRDIHEKIQHKVNRKRVLSKLLLAAFYNDKQIQNVTENKARIRSPLTEF